MDWIFLETSKLALETFDINGASVFLMHLMQCGPFKWTSALKRKRNNTIPVLVCHNTYCASYRGAQVRKWCTKRVILPILHKKFSSLIIICVFGTGFGVFEIKHTPSLWSQYFYLWNTSQKWKEAEHEVKSSLFQVPSLFLCHLFVSLNISEVKH